MSNQNNWNMPTLPGKYMKFKQGPNRLRILSEPIKGFEYWVTKTTEDGEEKRTPIRKRVNEKIPVGEIEMDNPVRAFLAFVVWNYEDKAVQILNITQRTIAEPIAAYKAQEAWGSPIGTKGYDLVITKTGEGRQNTSYSVIANPKTPLDKRIIEKFEDMKINLEALYEGKDPFETEEEVKPEDIKI